LLLDEPNVWLSAAADIDESAVLSLCGDIRGAVELAEKGAAQAADSGWSRGKVAASGNLAFCYVALGDFDRADHELAKTQQEPFSSPSLLLAFADTRARAALARGDTRLAERLLERRIGDVRAIQRWYDVVALSTRVRALLMRSEFVPALGLAEEGLRAAEATQMDDAVVAFTFMKAEAQIGAAQRIEPSELLSGAHQDWPPARLADRRVVLSRAFSAMRQPDRRELELGRAARIYSASETLAGAPTDVRQTGPTAPAPATLDSAVALLELAGHPHILGREAFAILDGTGCCAQLALLTVGPTIARAVAVAGWTEAEAVTALASAKPEEITLLGPHRDDSWQLLVRPGPDLDDHCTVAAVRQLVDIARTLDRYRRDEQERNALWPAESLDGDPESIWISEQSIELLSNARRIASNPSPVLITGETGTGKEMLARAIHRASQRAERPLQAFNCSAVPRDMLESQLFGHKRGAFTGADTASPGVIRAAAGGTLFLDEIAELNLELQPKLLRFLDRQEIHPLGEPHPITVDVRVIAATNADVERLVAEGRFREDLFHRLNVIPLRIPPLRERREEIPPLVEHYLRRVSVEQKKGNLSISDEVLEYLVLYNWPGNIRQLANEVRRMVAFADRDSTLTPALLSPEILASRRTIAASSTEPEIRVRLDQPLPSAVDHLEQTMVRHALERSHGRVEEAARLLGISRKGLFLKRRRWGVREVS